MVYCSARPSNLTRILARISCAHRGSVSRACVLMASLHAPNGASDRHLMSRRQPCRLRPDAPPPDLKGETKRPPWMYQGHLHRCADESLILKAKMQERDKAGPCAGTVAAAVVDNILDTLPVEIQAAARAKLARYTEELKERYI